MKDIIKEIAKSRFYIDRGVSYYINGERHIVEKVLFLDIVGEDIPGYIVNIYMPDGTKQLATVSEKIFPGTIKISNMNNVFRSGMFNLK